MSTLILAIPGNEHLQELLMQQTGYGKCDVEFRNFPDGETYMRLYSNVVNKNIIILCSLHQPNEKILPLLFTCNLLKEKRAKKITLVAPYLGYMRQDKEFKEGEAITSKYFAGILSPAIDELITIDPHLHRRSSMNEIYTVPCKVLHTTLPIALWIKQHVPEALLIGPDSESEQWVAEIAKHAGSAYIIAEKKRKGDKKVEILLPEIKKGLATPVLIDDIISTAQTMIHTVELLKNTTFNKPICIGVHPIFAEDSWAELRNAGVQKIVTCNTIQHNSNAIDISSLIAKNILSPKK